MLFNMDVSHMASSAPGIPELLEQIVCFWLTAHFSLLITTMYFLEKNHFRGRFRKGKQE